MLREFIRESTETSMKVILWAGGVRSNGDLLPNACNEDKIRTKHTRFSLSMRDKQPTSQDKVILTGSFVHQR